MARKSLPFGQWPSPLDTKAVFSQPQAPQFPQRVNGQVYFLRSLPEQGGRIALVRLESDGREMILTPEGFNIRTRVHEYGGQCHVLADDTCWFVNFADQRLYRQALSGGEPVAITPAPAENDLAAVAGQVPSWMLADLCLHPNGRWLLAIGERARQGTENQNAIVAIDLQASETTQRFHILAEGADFYCSPVLAPGGDRLAFVSWVHPNMPWDRSALQIGHFDAESGQLTELNRIIDGEHQSACQPVFDFDGSLVFACDEDVPPGQEAAPENYWNLYRHTKDGKTAAITQASVEYGAPQWVFGYQRIQPIGEGHLLVVGTGDAGEQLEIIKNGERRRLGDGQEYVGCRQLAPMLGPGGMIGGYALTGQAGGPGGTDGKGGAAGVGATEVLLVADRADRGASVLSVETGTGKLTALTQAQPVLDKADVSVATPVAAPTRDKAVTHAWAYAPCNSAATGPADERPPLVVMVHGGPTSRSGNAFDPLKQFWTTRGFAVLDVNHRGSTGHGRAYRQVLHGQWGVIDVDDVIDAIEYHTGLGLADPARVFIRGGSAGGFAVLAALTRYPDVFAAGACYYGIGNLVTLQLSTHKFESRYTDSLVGETWHDGLVDDTRSAYYTRSPIHHMDQVKSPMILFQGSEDKVVPPEVSREVVRVLERLGIAHRYVEFEGEGHGFRIAANRLDALEAEAAFFLDAMGGQLGKIRRQ